MSIEKIVYSRFGNLVWDLLIEADENTRPWSTTKPL